MEYKNINDLHEWDKNSQVRQITEANFLKLKANIKRNGIIDLFKITADGEILDGNHRYKAIKSLIEEGFNQTETGKDLTQVPVEVVVIEKESDKWNIALNSNSEYASYTEDLSNFLPEFEDEIDISLINIDFNEPASIDEQIDENGPKQKKLKEVSCPSCGHTFTI